MSELKTNHGRLSSPTDEIKGYLVWPSEIESFKNDYTKMIIQPNFGFNYYLKAWVFEFIEKGRLKVIVSNRRPEALLIKSRLPESDEKLPSSRQDTLYGDIKLVAKKMYRDVKHRNSIIAESSSANIEVSLLITRLPEVELKKLEIGEEYVFQVLPKPDFLSFVSSVFSTTTMIVGTKVFIPTKISVSNSYSDFKKLQKKAMLIGVATLLVICWGACTILDQMGASLSPSRLGGKARQHSSGNQNSKHQAGWVSLVKMTFDEFAAVVKSKSDIPVLMSSMDSKYQSRSESGLLYRNIYIRIELRKGWDRVSPKKFELGLVRLITIWRGLYSHKNLEQTEINAYYKNQLVGTITSSTQGRTAIVKKHMWNVFDN